MQVAAASFENTIARGSPSGGHTGAVVEQSHGFQQTRILLLHAASASAYPDTPLLLFPARQYASKASHRAEIFASG
jgi:hypothetical protein